MGILGVLGIILLTYLFFDIFLGTVTYLTNKFYSKSGKPCCGRYTPIRKNGVTTFVTDGKFKILTISDTHLGGGLLSGNEDFYALRKIRTLIKRTRPDLVIVTGDIVYTTKFQTLNNNNKKAMKLISRMLDKMQVYWAPVFGNHDSEHAEYSRSKMGEFLESDKCKYCLFESGDTQIDGIGNYIINVENASGCVLKTLYFLDSNEYYKKSVEQPSKDHTKYDNVHKNQIEWYCNKVDEMKNINLQNNFPPAKSLLFIHIPLAEFKSSWAKGSELSGKKRENICPGYNYNFLNKIVEKDDTLAVFCGHDHTNDFVIEVSGVKLCYVGSIDYLAYVWTKFYNPARGGRVIDIANDECFTHRINWQNKAVGRIKLD